MIKIFKEKLVLYKNSGYDMMFWVELDHNWFQYYSPKKHRQHKNNAL